MGRQWTKEEEALLAEEWGMYSADTIAKHLGRTRDAVVVRVARLGLGGHLKNSAMISFNVLIETLGLRGG